MTNLTTTQLIEQGKVGSQVTGCLAIRDCSVRAASNGLYIDLLLCDQSGAIPAKIWNMDKCPYRIGDVIKLQGDIDIYRGKKQIIVQKHRLAKPEEYDLNDFLPGQKDLAPYWGIVDAVISEIENIYLGRLVEFIYSDEAFRSGFADAPATRRVHHNYRGGALEQAAEMVLLAKTVGGLFPKINMDILISGILLINAAKPTQMKVSVAGVEHTDAGELVGDILLASNFVTRAISRINGFPDELEAQLQHMIAASHGRYEWASPRQPQTVEAVALYQIKELTANLNRFTEAVKGVEQGAWTTTNSLLGRPLYASVAPAPQTPAPLAEAEVETAATN